MIAMIFLFCCKEKKKKKILELLQKLISLHGSIFTNFYSLKKKKKISKSNRLGTDIYICFLFFHIELTLLM